MEATEVVRVDTAQIDDSCEVWFTAYSLGKRRLGSARIYKDTAKYSGPTKSGVDMTCEQIEEVVPILMRLSAELDDGTCVPPCEYARLPAGSTADWVVQVIPHSSEPSVFLLDIRKFVRSDKFSGPTRKGIRLAVDYVDDLATGLRDVALSIHEWRQGVGGLFARETTDEAARDSDMSDGAGTVDSVPEHLRDYF